MSKSNVRYVLPGVFSLYFLLCASIALAAEEAVQDELAPKHKVVIQLSSDDPLVHRTALNNAMNLQKALGMDNVAVEIVAYGPGVKLFTTPSPENMQVPSMAQQNITFSACGNTLNQLTQQMGRAPTLAQGVKVVPAGIVRIMELQEQGYAYIRP